MSNLESVATEAKAFSEKVPAASSLTKQLIDYLQRADTGGLPGLVAKFEKTGIGPQIQSWIGTDKKLPVTADEVTRALGSAEVAQMATKAGISPQQASQQLSELLPEMVRHFSPSGKLPQAATIADLGTSFKAKFGI